MIRTIVAPRATADIEELVEFIAADNPDAALRIRDGVYEAIRRIGARPGIGHRRPDLTRQPYLFLTALRRYLIVYRPDAEAVVILRVFNRGQDVRRRLR